MKTYHLFGVFNTFHLFGTVLLSWHSATHFTGFYIWYTVGTWQDFNPEQLLDEGVLDILVWQTGTDWCEWRRGNQSEGCQADHTLAAPALGGHASLLGCWASWTLMESSSLSFHVLFCLFSFQLSNLFQLMEEQVISPRKPSTSGLAIT